MVKAISHVGRLLGVPSVVFYDSENAHLQTRLAWPFVTHLTVPADYDGPVPAGRTTRLPGTKELSYFHPTIFRPDRDRAIAAGLDPERANVLVRLVEWRANHDLGKGGWTPEIAERFVAAIAPRAAIHVSAEADVPSAFEPYLWRRDPGEFHQLLAFCEALVGESATVACEAVALGVPAVYAGMDFPGYTRGLAKRGLLTLLEPHEHQRLPEVSTELLDDRSNFLAAREAWLASCPDWAESVVQTADAFALSMD